MVKLYYVNHLIITFDSKLNEYFMYLLLINVNLKEVCIYFKILNNRLNIREIRNRKLTIIRQRYFI